MGADVVSREELYELVWSVPMVKVAEKFKVSGSYMARVCSTLHVPHPERGYWAKLAVGKAPEKPSLPDAQPGDQLSWSQEGGLQSPPRPRLTAPSPRPGRRQLPRLVTGVHGLIRDAKEHFDEGYKVEEGQHLRPHKRLLVDVTASRAALDKALAFANDLFNALESAGHRVLICSPAENFTRPSIEAHEQLSKARQERQDSYYYDRRWSPQRPTVVDVARSRLVLQSSKCQSRSSFDTSTESTSANLITSLPKHRLDMVTTVGRRRRTFLVAACDWWSTRPIVASPGRYCLTRAKIERSRRTFPRS